MLPRIVDLFTMLANNSALLEKGLHVVLGDEELRVMSRDTCVGVWTHDSDRFIWTAADGHTARFETATDAIHYAMGPMHR